MNIIRIFYKQVVMLMLGFAFLAWHPSASASAAHCSDDSPRCWYMIFGTGDAPKRDLFIARRIEAPDSAVSKKVEVVQVLEATGLGDYAIYSMEFNCKQRKFRIVNLTVATMDSKLQSKANALDWTAVPQSWIDRAYTFGCDSTVSSNPEKLDMTYFLNLFRPADIADIARKSIWGDLVN